MYREAVGLTAVFEPRQDLQVVGDMQTTHQRMAQWDDVVDFVLDAGVSSHPDRLAVDRTDRGLISPSWRGSKRGCQTFTDSSSDAVRICSRPRFICGAAMFSVCGTPFNPVTCSLFSMVSVPLRISHWVAPVVCSRSRAGALAARIRQGIWRSATFREVFCRLVQPAHVAAFQPVTH